MMTHPTTKSLINRQEQREEIEKLLDRLQKGEVRFEGLEFYGVAGLGKSRILEEVKRQCRERGFMFVTIDCWVGKLLDESALEMNILSGVCEQIEQRLPCPQLRAVVGWMRRNGTVEPTESTKPEDQSTSKNHLLPFRARLVEALGSQPLVIVLEDVQHCPEVVFDWLGKELIAPLVAEGYLPGMALFLGGRGQHVERWPGILRHSIRSLQLDPFDFQATEEHLRSLPPDGRYADAAKVIYGLSNGHPYSTEALAYFLSQLDVPVDAVNARHIELAQQLYDEVIKRYIFAEAPEWVLPFVEVASIPRQFDPALLMDLVQKYRPGLAPTQPIQWYRARLVDLQRRPLHLIQITPGQQGYQLTPPLRRLLHVALAIQRPADTFEMHHTVKETYRQKLLDTTGRDAPLAAHVLEILYHTAQIRAITHDLTETAARPPVGFGGATSTPRDPDSSSLPSELDILLKQHFHRDQSHGVGELNKLRDLLQQDAELKGLVNLDEIDDLEKQIDYFLQPPIPVRAIRAVAAVYRESYLVIDRSVGTEYSISWYLVNQAMLTNERIHSALRFQQEDWRRRLDEIGQAAFHTYLPTRAQGFMRQHRDWAIQLTTNTSDIPWELLHDGEEFLCLSRPIARQPSSVKDPREHPAKPDPQFRALVIGNPTGDLKGAEAEARAVQQLLEQKDVLVECLVGPREATAKEFSIRLAKSQRYDLIHYAGHAHYDPTSPHLSYLKFADAPFFAEELERGLMSRAFLFLSACQGGAGVTETSKVGYRGEFMEGLAIAALLGGALGCLGPLWEIEDGLAKDFALKFYERLLGGYTIGEAVLEARRKIRDEATDSDQWASWVLYGKPLQTLPVKPGSQAQHEE